MDLFSDMRLFASIVVNGSMAAAGRELGLSPASITARIKALEHHFQTPLLIRSTRSLSLTPEGRALYQSAKRVLAEVDDLMSVVHSEDGSVRGTLRVTAPFDLGRQHVQPMIDEFLYDTPHARVELVLSDRAMDLVSESIDVGIRYGPLIDGVRVLEFGQGQIVAEAMGQVGVGDEGTSKGH